MGLFFSYRNLSTHSTMLFNVLISRDITLKKTESDFMEIKVNSTKTSN